MVWLRRQGTADAVGEAGTGSLQPRLLRQRDAGGLSGLLVGCDSGRGRPARHHPGLRPDRLPISSAAEHVRPRSSSTPTAGCPAGRWPPSIPTTCPGSDFTGAWAQGNIGRDDILIAYMEGGVNYSSDAIKDALDNEWLNKGELPCSERADGTSLAWPNCYDLDGNGRFDIRDYVHDPRLNPSCPAGVASDTPVAREIGR